MEKCPYLPGCVFFNDKMLGKPATAELYKQTYCLDSPKQCARLIVREALGKEKVPADLFPNDRARADAILADAGPSS